MTETTDLDAAWAAYRAAALDHPETTEEFPWGDVAFKVKGKSFVFAHHTSERVSWSVKLTDGRDAALTVPNAAPTGYNLGKSGWVTLRFERGDSIPVDAMIAWTEESFRAVAPKGVLKKLGTR